MSWTEDGQEWEWNRLGTEWSGNGMYYMAVLSPTSHQAPHHHPGARKDQEGTDTLDNNQDNHQPQTKQEETPQRTPQADTSENNQDNQPPATATKNLHRHKNHTTKNTTKKQQKHTTTKTQQKTPETPPPQKQHQHKHKNTTVSPPLLPGSGSHPHDGVVFLWWWCGCVFVVCWRHLFFNLTPFFWLI